MKIKNRNDILWIPAAMLIVLGLIFSTSADSILGYLFIASGVALLVVALIARRRRP